jgi:hypothetical protein
VFASSFNVCSILLALGSSVANVVNLAGQGAMVVNLASPPYNLAAPALRSDRVYFSARQLPNSHLYMSVSPFAQATE